MQHQFSDYKVLRYTKTFYNEWNDFVGRSKNGTFLFHRDFMEYHKDRFEDFSLMVFKRNKLIAILPANKSGNVITSHEGLTYGGLVLPFQINFNEVSAIYNVVIGFLRVESIESLVIKELPLPYQKRPSEELAFLLNNHGRIIDTQMVLAIDYNKPLLLHKTKKKYNKQGKKRGLELRRETNFEVFWNQVLIPRLAEKHNTRPVHALEEIQLLHKRFPDKIYQYNVYFEKELLAGITIFETDTVVKSQYGATSEKGEQLRAFDYLFVELIHYFKDKKQFFSQGTVAQQNDLGYNSGLLKQKQELGCEVYLQHTFQIIV